MSRKNLRFPITLLATFSVIVTFLLSQRGTAQQVAARSPPSVALQSIRRLPAAESDRKRIADLAISLVPKTAPSYLRHSYHASLLAPPFVPGPRRFVGVPDLAQKFSNRCAADHIYSEGAFPTKVRQRESDTDWTGCEGTYLPGGPVTTSTNAFFMSLGTNGRTCATCHQPPSGMSVSEANIVARLRATAGTDPIFAGVDGANCPTNLPPFIGNGAAFKAAHSLLLKRGLFRIFIPVPAGAQFTVSVQHDPYGCNTNASFNQDTINGQTVQMVSSYRRPRVSANLNFILSFIPPTGSAGIMWDAREPSLQQQAQNATTGHAQAQGTVPLTAVQVAQIVAFETQIFSAQVANRVAGSLHAAGATGGPLALSSALTGQGGPPSFTTFDEYNAWAGLSGNTINDQRASIARGEILFNTRQFIVSNVAGVNDVLNVPTFTATCSGCHSQQHAGNDVFGKAAAFDLGVSGDSAAHSGPPPSPMLPIFTVSCTGGRSTPFNGSTVTTNDLGVAMTTGQCVDIGKFLVPQLRAVSSHPPFFHDGSAKTLMDVVNFYDKRFTIGFTLKQRRDLVNFLDSL